MPQPKYNLGIGSGTHGEQTGKMLIRVERVLLREKPDIVLVEGDTNTVLAGALAASKLHIKIGHVEAGLRSRDKNMSEEINRILVDHCSDYLFAPTKKAKNSLINEGIPPKNIFVTGNTIVDAVYQNLKIADKKVNILDNLNLKPKEYFVLTAHRQENVDIKERLEGILKGMEMVFKKYKLPIIYPIHPRSKKMIENFKLKVPKGLKIIEPIGFLDFSQLEANAKLVLTDSGGVQEETCILQVPCVTLRNNTERPETLEVRSNILAGADPKKILESVRKMLSKKRKWRNPFGSGKSSEKIASIMENSSNLRHL